MSGGDTLKQVNLSLSALIRIVSSCQFLLGESSRVRITRTICGAIASRLRYYFNECIKI